MCRVRIWVVSVVFTLAVVRVVLCDDHHCASTQTDPYLQFSTKTPYAVVRNQEETDKAPVGCTPVQLWLTARHGTRYPGDDDIAMMNVRLPQLRDEILLNAASGKTQLCHQDLELFRYWSMKFDVSVENNLTPSGEKELFDLARRMQQRFPKLLSGPYKTSSYKFLTTSKQRAIESGRHFARGLFGNAKVEFPEPKTPDPLLQFYKTCSKWIDQVDDSEDARKERYAFQNSSAMLKTIRDVSFRLGFSEKNLTYSDLKLMYDMCRYEKSLELESVSTWCAAFSLDDFKVFEFDMDLEYYWTDSYGYSVNYLQACPQVRDFVESFTSRRDRSDVDHPLAYLYFSHLGGVLKFITRLGLHNDSRPLLHTDFGRSHAFSSSRLAAFASNVALVLYKCSAGPAFRVQCLLQEHPTLLPGCRSLFCPLDTVLEKYGDVVRDCDVSSFCDVAESWTTRVWNSFLFALPGLLLL